MCCTPNASDQPGRATRDPGERLGVQDFIPDPAVDLLCKAVPLRRSGLDAGRAGGGAGLALVA
jgi:hypothetical protein